MAGFVFCCVFLVIIASAYLLIALGTYFIGDGSYLSILLKSVFYFFLFCVYISLYGQAMNEMHKTALDFIKRKEENKRICKEEQVKQNAGNMITIIIKHLLFLVITISAAVYFQLWYIKLPIIFYLCSIFGYVACFPLSEESTAELVQDKFYWKIQKEIFCKTAINTVVFLSMTFIYAYYTYA